MMLMFPNTLLSSEISSRDIAPKSVVGMDDGSLESVQFQKMTQEMLDVSIVPVVDDGAGEIAGAQQSDDEIDSVEVSLVTESEMEDPLFEEGHIILTGDDADMVAFAARAQDRSGSEPDAPRWAHVVSAMVQHIPQSRPAIAADFAVSPYTSVDQNGTNQGHIAQNLIDYLVKSTGTGDLSARDISPKFSQELASKPYTIDHPKLQLITPTSKFEVMTAHAHDDGTGLTAVVRETGQGPTTVVHAHFAGLGRSEGLTSGHANQIWAQVRDKIQNTPTGQIIVEVNPPDTGKLRIAFDLTRDVAHIAVVSERLDYVSAMRRAADVLGQEIKAMGYEGVEFSFAAGGSSASDQGDHQPSRVDHAAPQINMIEAEIEAHVVSHRQDTGIVVRI